MHISWVLQMLKTTTKWKKLTRWWLVDPTPSGAQWLVMLTALLLQHQPENYAWADHTPCKPSPLPDIKKCFAKTFLGFQGLGEGAINHLFFHGPARKLSLLQTWHFGLFVLTVHQVHEFAFSNTSYEVLYHLELNSCHSSSISHTSCAMPPLSRY